MCDDFDSDGEITTDDLLWNKITADLEKEGYRDGLDYGQEGSLQDGFDAGFAKAGEHVYPVAALRGRISGKLAFSLMVGGNLTSEQTSKLEELLGDVLDLETELLDFSSASHLSTVDKAECNMSSSCCKRSDQRYPATELIDSQTFKNEAVGDNLCDNESVVESGKTSYCNGANGLLIGSGFLAHSNDDLNVNSKTNIQGIPKCDVVLKQVASLENRFHAILSMT
ncbi:protein YAE1 homolog isoform X2 [Dreissena polymorpha]|uniref:protein YAE1 homolog isoform X2 n=1 Tax=Dreissena polymorpha TaxID=45954 RepID=UPI002264A970|nr:protein YAE1 homolog isoform X2 [Dreissena polymorpha]